MLLTFALSSGNIYDRWYHDTTVVWLHLKQDYLSVLLPQPWDNIDVSDKHKN